MKKEHYYLASRIPSKGGLTIVRKDDDFPKEYEAYIEENCLEIFVPEYDFPAFMIYPLGNGDVVTAIARKVESSQWESRVHENIFGYVLEGKTVTEQLLPLLKAGGKSLEDCFYDWKVEELDRLRENRLEFCPSERKSESGNEFFDEMEMEKKEAFFYSVYQTILKNKKIHLVVPRGISRMVQAACYEVLPIYFRSRLSTVSGGEVLQSDVNILLTEGRELKYQEAGRYKQMDLEAFIRQGMAFKRTDLSYFNQWIGEPSGSRAKFYEYMDQMLAPFYGDQEATRILMSLEFYDLLSELILHMTGEEACDASLRKKIEESKDWKVKRMLQCCFPHLYETRRDIKPMKPVQPKETVLDSHMETCRKYMKKEYPLQFVLREIREYYYTRERKKEWILFQKELRRELECLPLVAKRKERYISLLFLAYENYRGKVSRGDQNVLPSPYDLEGMALFLRQKTKTEREYRIYFMEVMRHYNEVFFIYMPERKCRRLLRRNCKNEIVIP